MTFTPAAAPEVVLIAARARNGVIGRDNALPWRLKGDLQRFRALTMGHPIIMGRKTWESLGRPLPGRRNLVVTRNPHWQAAGAEAFPTPAAALAAAAGAERVFIIGGAELYHATLALADTLLLTEVHADVDGDAHFPAFDSASFREVARVAQSADADNHFAVDFVDYRRIRR